MDAKHKQVLRDEDCYIGWNRDEDEPETYDYGAGRTVIVDGNITLAALKVLVEFLESKERT